MTDTELLKITLDRLNLTNKETAAMFGVSERSIAHYIAGRYHIPGDLWRLLLEHEAKVYQRQQDVIEAARGMGSVLDPHAGKKRRGRPRMIRS